MAANSPESAAEKTKRPGRIAQRARNILWNGHLPTALAIGGLQEARSAVFHRCNVRCKSRSKARIPRLPWSAWRNYLSALKRRWDSRPFHIDQTPDRCQLGRRTKVEPEYNKTAESSPFDHSAAMRRLSKTTACSAVVSRFSASSAASSGEKTCGTRFFPRLTVAIVCAARINASSETGASGLELAFTGGAADVALAYELSPADVRLGRRLAESSMGARCIYPLLLKRRSLALSAIEEAWSLARAVPPRYPP